MLLAPWSSTLHAWETGMRPPFAAQWRFEALAGARTARLALGQVRQPVAPPKKHGTSPNHREFPWGGTKQPKCLQHKSQAARNAA